MTGMPGGSRRGRPGAWKWAEREGSRLPWGLLLCALLLASPAAAPAQEIPAAPAPTPRQVLDPAMEQPVTPAGAFLRSLAVPGWGHVATGAPTRGAFYVGAQSATAWMLWKSASQRRTAQRFRRLELRAVENELRRTGVTDPDSLRILAEGSSRVERWDELVDRRGDQVEDWAALAIFLVLLGATDAFVSAHLADFPEPLSLQVLPLGPRGGWEVGLRLPLGRAVPLRPPPP